MRFFAVEENKIFILQRNQIKLKSEVMKKTVFNDLYNYIEKHGDRIFIISMLTLVMVVAFAFKKPNPRKIGDDRNFSNVEYAGE
ncbi:hypothetical protein SAMN04487995_2963 [Dyadobacter koreensis]|uniref:Uncharacterized protein n=2 Tax=Dyadobacter koreensis TaxID=408657 RepID=A0A1H6V670_9BACT|nr:hypothetical protein SAMN04487995_2963 [Dyadobacter koreensis]